MFVDASAIVAILAGEAEAEVLAERLVIAGNAVTSAIAIFEAVLAIARKHRNGLGPARQVVADFLVRGRVSIVALTEAEAWGALDAFAAFGKGTGHPAKLNMGDCFAYAAAVRHDAALLFKG